LIGVRERLMVVQFDEESYSKSKERHLKYQEDQFVRFMHLQQKHRRALGGALWEKTQGQAQAQ